MQYLREYYQNNKQRLSHNNKNWAKNNPEKSRQIKGKWRIKKPAVLYKLE
jgi:hypothetical protein